MTTSLCEPPSTAPPLLVGKNSRGCWTVRDPRGRAGGFFISRAEALHYARLEAGHAPGAVIVAPDGLELDLASASRPWATALRDWIRHRAPVLIISALLLSFSLALLCQLRDVDPDLLLRSITISSTTVLGALLGLGAARWLLTKICHVQKAEWPRYRPQRR
jgi:hypothetical protein